MDLLGRPQPEQRNSMHAIKIRHQHRRHEREQQKVSNQEIARLKTELDHLDDVLARGLAERMRAEAAAVPFTGPPRAVGLVMLELAREDEGDDEFVDCALDGDDGEETDDDVRAVPEFEDPLYDTRQHHYHGRKGRGGRTKNSKNPIIPAIPNT